MWDLAGRSWKRRRLAQRRREEDAETHQGATNHTKDTKEDGEGVLDKARDSRAAKGVSLFWEIFPTSPRETGQPLSQSAGLMAAMQARNQKT
jgi:hypothetical protein